MTTPSNKQHFDDRISGIEKRLEAGDERMSAIEAMVSDVHEIIVTARGFFRVLSYVGDAVKWVVAVGSALAAIYAAWKGAGLGGGPK